MGAEIIRLSGLTKEYGHQAVVRNLDLTIEKGEIYGLLGPNGAGKSTTILMIMGLTEPSSGSIRVAGVDPVRYPVEVKRKVGYLPEDVGFYDDRTGLENIVYTGRLNGLSVSAAKSRALELLERVDLTEAAHKRTGTYSRGMRQRLGLADVLIKQPEIIILDEPTLGLDPEGLRRFLSLIVTLSRQEGLTVLLSSHHLQQVQQVCDRVGLFVAGRLIAEGDIPALSKKLFPNELIAYEAGLHRGARADADWIPMRSRAADAVRHAEGVRNFHVEGDRLFWESDTESGHEIARNVIASGIDLTYLNRKEYGLDEIYHRYFSTVAKS
ncbi:MAG: ABC transporter ATP-binding protein [Cytophagaceae bacterium SCN 52-12]|nr:MAG: ABC transporter ATP-binding protein [Cytophagaceae bacterium SCN 52-12]